MYWPEAFRYRELWVYVNGEPTKVPAFQQGYAKGRGHPRIREPGERRREWTE